MEQAVTDRKVMTVGETDGLPDPSGQARTSSEPKQSFPVLPANGASRRPDYGRVPQFREKTELLWGRNGKTRPFPFKHNPMIY
ncbi:hypothetical protein AB4144_39605 [Rhizobiaceae sp. 2RAB30]